MPGRPERGGGPGLPLHPPSTPPARSRSARLPLRGPAPSLTDGRPGAELLIRPATSDDEPQILGLLTSSLGWLPDRLHRDFFAWKHRRNPFGPSPAWVAVVGTQVAGFRTFLRWEFNTPTGRVRAVRAVDTATHPDHRGRGIFRRLTLAGLDALGAEGVQVVFNTPNDLSRPGYLKMGWEVAGRVALRVRPGGVPGLTRMARARTPADLWSLECDAGVPATEVLADGGVSELLAAQPVSRGLRTHRTRAYLRWRYGFEPLHYRALVAGDVRRGVVVFRLRRRGAAVEATVCELLVARERRGALRRQLVRRVLQESGADYALCSAADGRGASLLPVPGQGPTLTWRPAATPPRVLVRPGRSRGGAWHLSLGDVELL